MKVAELREMTIKELQNEVNALAREQFNLRIKNGIGTLSQPHRLKVVRRNIARVKTILANKLREENHD